MLDAKHLYRQSTNLQYNAEQSRKYAEKLAEQAADELRHGNNDKADARQQEATRELEHANELEHQAHQAEGSAKELEGKVADIEREMQAAQDAHDAKMKDLEKQRRSLLG